MFAGPALAGAVLGGGGLALAVNKARLRDGQSKRPLAVRPVGPRSLREGDRADLVCWFRGLYAPTRSGSRATMSR